MSEHEHQIKPSVIEDKQARHERLARENMDKDGFYAYLDIPEKVESIADLFGIIKTNRTFSLEDKNKAIAQAVCEKFERINREDDN